MTDGAAIHGRRSPAAERLLHHAAVTHGLEYIAKARLASRQGIEGHSHLEGIGKPGRHQLDHLSRGKIDPIDPGGCGIQCPFAALADMSGTLRVLINPRAMNA